MSNEDWRNHPDYTREDLYRAINESVKSLPSGLDIKAGRFTLDCAKGIHEWEPAYSDPSFAYAFASKKTKLEACERIKAKLLKKYGRLSRYEEKALEDGSYLETGTDIFGPTVKLPWNICKHCSKRSNDQETYDDPKRLAELIEESKKFLGE